MKDSFERFRKSGYVRWSELSPNDQQSLLTTGHPSNRPPQEVIDQNESRFRPGKVDRRGRWKDAGWIIGFAF